MGWNGSYISKPVSMSDVKSAIGSSSNDLATLCTSTAINRWSKYKPIFHSGVEALTNAQFAEDTGGTSGYRITYGIKRPNSYAATDLVQSGVIQNRPWEYVRPAGGTSSPYRLSDFASKENSYGYSILGVCPIDMRIPTSDGFLPIPKEANDGMNLDFYFLFGPAVNRSGNVWLPEHSIAYTDLLTSTELGYYPTILLNYKSGNVVGYYCMSCSSTVSAIASSGSYVGRVSINTKTLRDTMNTRTDWWNEGAEWGCVFFLSQNKMTGVINALPSGKISRLQYQGTQVLGSPDFFLYKVRRTTWVDDMNGLKFTATIIPRGSGYANQYNVSVITVNYDTKVNRTLAVTVKYSIDAVNNSGQRLGYMSNANGQTVTVWVNGVKYDTVLSHTINLDMQMVNRGTITFTIGSAYHVTDPNFVFVGSYPNNVKPAYVTLEFSYGNYSISRTAVIDCNGITTSKSATTTLIGS